MTNEKIREHFKNISKKYGLDDFEEVSRKIREAKRIEEVEKNIPDYREELKKKVERDWDEWTPKSDKMKSDGKKKGLIKAADLEFMSNVKKILNSHPDYDIISKQAKRRTTQIERFEKQALQLDENTLIAFRGRSVKNLLEEGFEESDIQDKLKGTGFEIRNGKIERIASYIG